MHLALVQPLYRARKSGECTRISIDGTKLRSRVRRYWAAHTALCAFSTEKGFTFLNSSCTKLLDNMHLALVQPLYRARKTRECTRISIDGTVLRTGNGGIERPVQLCVPFAPRKGLHI